MPKKEYDWELGQCPPLIEPHTIVKQNIYQSYIEQYITTLNQDPKIPSFNLAVVDAFAGGGLYLDTNGNEHQGSPIKIIEAIKNSEKYLNSTRNNPFTLKSCLFFIEKKKPVFEYLKKHLFDHEHNNANNFNIETINSNFERVYLDVVKNIANSLGKNVRAIFILDQYGYVDVPFECIRNIFKYLPKSEVILTLSVNHLIDYIADPEKEIQKAAQINLFSEAEPSKKIESGKQVRNYLAKLGLNVEELQESKAANCPRTFRGTVESKLLEQLLIFSEARFYTPFFLGEIGYHRDMWLVHLSNHSEARSVMMDIHWQYANSQKAIISHYGDYGLDMLGFRGNKNIIQNPDLFELQSHFDFSNDAKDKMNVAIQEEMPEQLHGKEVVFKDFYEAFANHILVSKPQLIEQAKIALQCKGIEAVGKKGQIRRSDIKINDIIRLPKQTYFDFKKHKK